MVGFNRFHNKLFFFFRHAMHLLEWESVLPPVGASLVLTNEYQKQPKAVTDLWNNTSPTPKGVSAEI